MGPLEPNAVLLSNDAMTSADLADLLAQPEGQSLEFGQLGGDIVGDLGAKSNAFANSNGGVHASPEDIRQRLQDAGRLSFEASPVWQATYQDLDEPRIAAYLERRSPGGVSANGRPTAELIRAIDLPLFHAEGGEETPNVACVLAFARQPQRFLPQAQINAVQYPGTEMSPEMLQRKVLTGTADDLIDAAAAFVLRGLSEWSTIPPSGTTRRDGSPLPPYAVRESLANAVMHREYGRTGEEIQVRLFADRLEVESPGGLPAPLTLADLDQPRSLARNPLLANVLRDFGKVERVGFGVNQMRRAMCDHGCEPPQFDTDGRWFRVVLPFRQRPPSFGKGSPMPVS